MRAGDTTTEAQALQTAILRNKTGAEKVDAAFELSRLVRDLMLAGLRTRHPEFSERELARALMRQLYTPAELPPDLP